MRGRLRGAELTGELGLAADLGTAGNWRGTSRTALTATVTQLLSLKASHALEYRHAPVTGFGRTDMRSGVALVFSVQRGPGFR